jgi:peptidoglycan/LPS O-acetylase OafA/YrhL
MNQRLHGLDSLRGLAALAVLVQHYISLIAAPGSILAEYTIGIVDLGKFGVSLFFLISGFVIPQSVGRGLQQFWVGRAFRLLPALWFSICFASLLGAQIDGPLHLLANALMVAGTLGEENLVSVYWTLNWELYFYLVVSALFLCNKLRDARSLCFLSIFLCGLSLFHPFMLYISMMLFGSLLNLIFVEKDSQSLRWLNLSLGAFFVAGFCWFLTDFRPTSFYTGVVLAIPVFLLTWNRLRNPVLIWVGSISYSLYLLHLPILEFASGFPAYAYTILGIGGSLLLSWTVFHWIERPMIVAGKRFNSSLVERNRKLTAQERPQS